MNIFNIWVGRVSSENGDGAWTICETSEERMYDTLARHCIDNWSEFEETWRISDGQPPSYEGKTPTEIIQTYYDIMTWEKYDTARCPITAEMLAAIPGSIVMGDSVVLTPPTD